MSDAYLNYNVRWMTRTFNSRTKVDALLGPELAAGNISTHDYEAASKFLPGYHRYYGLLLSMAALSAVYLGRRPSWSQRRTLITASGAAFGSLGLGNVLALKSHSDFVQALDNPAGFSRALQHIQDQSRAPPPPSLIISRRLNVEDDLHGNTGFVDDTIPEPTQEQPGELQPRQQLPRERPLSKWDQIRAANTATSTSSSWDALRQKHEKTRIQKPIESSSSSIDQRANETSNDRAAEQADFDALLERERRLGSGELRE